MFEYTAEKKDVFNAVRLSATTMSRRIAGGSDTPAFVTLFVTKCLLQVLCAKEAQVRSHVLTLLTFNEEPTDRTWSDLSI